MRWMVEFKPPYADKPLILYVDAESRREAVAKMRDFVAGYTTVLDAKERPDLVGADGPHRPLMVRGPIYPERVASSG